MEKVRGCRGYTKEIVISFLREEKERLRKVAVVRKKYV